MVERIFVDFFLYNISFSVSNRQRQKKKETEKETERVCLRLRSSEAYTNRRRRVILKRMVAVESRWKRSTFSFISMDMIRRA